MKHFSGFKFEKKMASTRNGAEGGSQLRTSPSQRFLERPLRNLLTIWPAAATFLGTWVLVLAGKQAATSSCRQKLLTGVAWLLTPFAMPLTSRRWTTAVAGRILLFSIQCKQSESARASLVLPSQPSFC
ncbi:hypothetical protein ACQJBY_059529 [Aegilops geniculata]